MSGESQSLLMEQLPDSSTPEELQLTGIAAASAPTIERAARAIACRRGFMNIPRARPQMPDASTRVNAERPSASAIGAVEPLAARDLRAPQPRSQRFEQ